jgi:hypothetical protein
MTTQRTSDDLHRLLLPDRNAIFGMSDGRSEFSLLTPICLPASAGPRESAQGDVSVREESPRDVVEGLCHYRVAQQDTDHRFDKGNRLGWCRDCFSSPVSHVKWISQRSSS